MNCYTRDIVVDLCVTVFCFGGYLYFKLDVIKAPAPRKQIPHRLICDGIMLGIEPITKPIMAQ